MTAWVDSDEKQILQSPRIVLFFGHQIHGKDSSVNMVELVERGSELEKSWGVLENILRWQEDGGPMMEVAKSIMSLQLDQIISKNEEVKL